jgi:CHAT domain-containing protein
VKAGFRASVVHGDLTFARYPIVVGHYQGDTIIGAEAQINRILDGALSDRYNLGLYPGVFGSVAVVLRQPTPMQQALGLPHGAVVIGLGKWGDLTAAQLANLIRRAALQYVLQLDDCKYENADASVEPATVGLSLLLLGGNSAANISTEDSVAAILRGVTQANREVGAHKPGTTAITEIEIIELYADTAIEAAHALRQLAETIGKELGVNVEAAPLLRRGKYGRNRLIPVAGHDPWRRWEISVLRESDAARRPKLEKPLAEKLKQAIVEAGTADKTDIELLAALADLALADSFVAREPHRELRFLTLSDRARAEVVAQQRQPELIERLISASVSKTAYRDSEARALFELMIPNELKDSLAQLSRVVLVVDEETSEYPWELMHDGVEPLCARIGLVRQLQTARFRPHIRATTTRTAYVVGDPVVSAPYRQLKGAKDEAKAVYDLLSTRFDVEPPVENPSALEVLGGLFKRPYRILHLAGHGQYEPPTTPGGKARSGMVLDNGVFLTAVEIGQMQQVPELVFLNCCYIGQTGPQQPSLVTGVEFNRLAASVSRELIEMGVRAIVAAGWAVRDDAALHFAGVFYEHMLGGERFGNALQKARRATWARPDFRECNTWGAYQAYGDPDFQLDPGGAVGRRLEPNKYVSEAELVDQLELIRRSASESRKKAADDEKERASAATQIDNLIKESPSEWLERSEVLLALGAAYGEVDQFDPAARYLRAALELETSDNATTLRAIEQLANFEVRAAERGKSEAEVRKAIERLESLLKVGPSSERYSLLGSAYKRLATLQQDAKAVSDSIRKAAERYRAAHQRALGRGNFDPYPALNWMTLSAIAGDAVPEAESILTRAETAARERFAKSRDFFDASAIPDAKVAVALVSGSLSDQVAELAALYADTFNVMSATPREIDSVTRQLALTASLMRKLSTGKTADARTKTAAALDAIVNTISGRMAAAVQQDGGGSRASRKPAKKPATAPAPGSTKKPPPKRPGRKRPKKGESDISS